MLLKLTGQYMWGLAGTGRWGKDEIDFVAQFTQPYLASLFKPTLQYTLLADHYVNPLCFKAHFIKSTTNCLDDLPGKSSIEVATDLIAIFNFRHQGGNH